MSNIPPPPPPPPGSSRSVRTPNPAEIVTMAGGSVAFLFSFFPFWTVPSVFDRGDFSAWSSGLFPVATFIALFALAGAALVALGLFGVNMPERILSYTKTQLVVAFGFFASVLALGFLIVDNSGRSLGFGYFLMLLGSIAVLVGGIMMMVEERKASQGGTL